MKITAVLLVLTLIGCAGPDSGGTSTELDEPGEDEVGATRASRELRGVQQTSAAAEMPGPTAAEAPEPPPPLAPASPTASPPLFVARVVDATQGENGRGEVVAAVSPIAFDLDGSEFPVRALDPVLHIGELRFTHYSYPSPGLLRFVAADRGAVPAGVEVAVQYGEEASSRRVVAPALEMP